jgi:hypothetical protein
MTMPDIRRVFDGFHIETVPIQYTVAGGKGVERNELIIFSWDDAGTRWIVLIDRALDQAVRQRPRKSDVRQIYAKFADEACWIRLRGITTDRNRTCI